MKPGVRKEKDTMGEMEVPEWALYGASTQRAVENFPISGRGMPEGFIRTVGLLKYACAEANEGLGKLSKEKAELIKRAAMEVYEGKLSKHFPVDVFQTGSCTSTNMNANEVIGNRVSEMVGKGIGSREPVHPNDDVNMGQSSNDTMPTVLHVSVAVALKEELMPALRKMEGVLGEKVEGWKDVVKIGRTHLMDATPLTLGQEFSGYREQVRKGMERVERGMEVMKELAIGGTAVGTGINCHKGFPEGVIKVISEKTGIGFRRARNHFEAQGGRDDCVEVAGILAAVAGSLTKIANDIRLLGSGPRSGIGELVLPATQPGSSIMPGKVNPVMSEMLVQVGIYVMGMSQSVVMCGRDGHFELNVTIPMMAYALLESIGCLARGVEVFTERCLRGLEVNRERCEELVGRSLMLVTALNPYIGYDKACAVAKRAFKENKSLKEVVMEEGLMKEEELDRALDARGMI